METKLKKIPNFDDIVFEIRNKQYGAYILRKKYNRNVIISLLVGITILSTSVMIPYMSAKPLDYGQKSTEWPGTIKLDDQHQQNETVVPPPPLPSPTIDVVKEGRYVPPVIVDSVKPEDATNLMTADQAQTEIRDREVTEIQPYIDEIPVEVTITEPFYKVEEMPEFPGGPIELQKYLAEHTQYPEAPKENNIQGRVIIKFCVTPNGGVDLVSVLKSIDSELDKEAIRVVNTLPTFKPGKQGGKPVPVWFVVPIIFQLK